MTHYEEKNRDLIARLAAQPPKPGQEAIRAKLKAAKAKFEICVGWVEARNPTSRIMQDK